MPELDATPQQPAPAPEPQAQGDEFDSLLAEFDAASPPARTEPDAARTNGNGHAAPNGKAQPEGPDVSELSRHVGELRDYVSANELERMQAREESDKSAAFDAGRKAIAEYAEALPDNFAEMWLKNHYDSDPEFQDAWDRRYENEARREHAMQAWKRAEREMVKQARAQHQRYQGREVAESREAIALYMTRGAGAAPAAPTSRDMERKISRMSDRELGDYAEKEFGIRVL